MTPLFVTFAVALAAGFAASAAMLCDEALELLKRGDDSVAVLAFIVSALGGGAVILLTLFALTYA